MQRCKGTPFAHPPLYRVLTLAFVGIPDLANMVRANSSQAYPGQKFSFLAFRMPILGATQGIPTTYISKTHVSMQDTSASC